MSSAAAVTTRKRDYPNAAAYLAEYLPALSVQLKNFPTCGIGSIPHPLGALARGSSAENEGHRSLPGFCLRLCWGARQLLVGARGLGLSDLVYRQVAQLKGVRSRQQDSATQNTA